MTGAALLGWGIGWALIATLSILFTDQPQRWALVPAGILGVDRDRAHRRHAQPTECSPTSRTSR